VERVSGLHRFLQDGAIGGIFTAIGGGFACQLLPLLDWGLIGKNPKIFMGFPNITSLNLAIYQRTGLTTFNGPMVMTDFGEFPGPLPYTLENVWRVLCRPDPPGELRPAPG
jgi:muramoyltetrapeptide carboxypeptidase LdcA involved in peptidoglycan recycling